MKVALYVRESDKDTKKAPPIAEQAEKGKQWAEDNNHVLVAILADNGYSGGDWKRPAWNKAVKMAKGHKIQALWVWDQDRLARDTEQFLWFYRQMNQAKVKIITPDGEVDMHTLGGRVKHTSLAMAHEIFRVQTSEKVKKTYEHKKKKAENLGQKVKWGRPRKVVDVKLVIELYDSGLGYRRIAEEIGVSYQTVRRVLQKAHPKLATISFLRTGNLEVLQNNPILERVKNCPPEKHGGISKEKA